MIDPLDTSTLEAARKEAGLSRAQLAERSGVHETTILRIEKREVDPRTDGTWAPLVRALSVASALAAEAPTSQEAA